MTRDIVLVFTDSGGYSGQRLASAIDEQCFKMLGFRTKNIALSGLRERSAARRIEGLLNMFFGWQECVRCGVKKLDAAHVNLGQSWISIVREGVSLVVFALMRVPERIVVLHGSILFSPQCPVVLRFALLSLLRLSTRISILSNRQYDFLLRHGVPGRKVGVVRNTCIWPQSHPGRRCERSPILSVLFFGNLLEAKGWSEYVDALILLGQRGVKVEAVLCGAFVQDDQNARFKNRTAAERFIAAAEGELLKTGIKFTYIPGASGRVKECLFEAAHVVVFPSFYRVEAQPLVLIEAMSKRCAIITTAVGDIGEMFEDDAVIWLEAVQPMMIANAIARLAREPILREHLAEKAHATFVRAFSFEAHLQAVRRSLCGASGLEPIEVY